MKHAEGTGDGSSVTAAAVRQDQAMRLLLDGGASQLPPRPWLEERQPPSAVDLILHLLWRANGSGPGAPLDALDVRAGLAVVSAARAEIEGLEAALLFLARAEGLTWPQISQSLGLRSPQAAQQRLDRLSGKPASGMAD